MISKNTIINTLSGWLFVFGISSAQAQFTLEIPKDSLKVIVHSNYSVHSDSSQSIVYLHPEDLIEVYTFFEIESVKLIPEHFQIHHRPLGRPAQVGGVLLFRLSDFCFALPGSTEPYPLKKVYLEIWSHAKKPKFVKFVFEDDYICGSNRNKGNGIIDH